MKIIRLFLLGTLFFQASYAQTLRNHYLYSYDSAGNIIFRFRTLPGMDGRADMAADDNKNDDDKANSRVHIKTDETWSEVEIEITGEITPGDILSIFSSDGLFVTSSRIVSNTFNLDLSALRQGTYLFRFKLNRQTSHVKLIKHN